MPATYEPIATATTTSDGQSITFSSIPSTYTDLFIAGQLRTARGITQDIVRIQFNSDTTTIYSSTYLEGDGSTASSSQDSAVNGITMSIAGANAPSTVFTTVLMSINNYQNSTTYKTSLIRNGSAQYKTRATVGLWRSTSAISSITFYQYSGLGLASGSTLTLYGIKAA